MIPQVSPTIGDSGFYLPHLFPQYLPPRFAVLSAYTFMLQKLTRNSLAAARQPSSHYITSRQNLQPLLNTPLMASQSNASGRPEVDENDKPMRSFVPKRKEKIQPASHPRLLFFGGNALIDTRPNLNTSRRILRTFLKILLKKDIHSSALQVKENGMRLSSKSCIN